MISLSQSENWKPLIWPISKFEWIMFVWSWFWSRFTLNCGVEIYAWLLRLVGLLLFLCVFMVDDISRLVDVISRLGLQKTSVLRHMSSVIQPILEKGIVDHSIIHKALIEYLSIADPVWHTYLIQYGSKLWSLEAFTYLSRCFWIKFV